MSDGRALKRTIDPELLERAESLKADAKRWSLSEQVPEPPRGFEPNPWYASDGERWKPKAESETGRREVRAQLEASQKIIVKHTGDGRNARRVAKADKRRANYKAYRAMQRQRVSLEQIVREYEREVG